MLERRMAWVVFVSLVLGLLEPVLCQRGGAGHGPPGPSDVTSATSGPLNLPIHIPSSLRLYEGTDLAIDSCPRDKVDINGTCHRLLTQGPCQPSEFVLLDPHTYEGYCAARLCAPDRVFVFNDQLCHDPFSSHYCQGDKELFQTAFGTPICQCPDGFLDGGPGQCMAPLTPTPDCPPGQVLWSDSARSMQVCGPDPCGRLNLDRPLPSPPFVPSLADHTCHQLGQGSGVCPPGTLYALDLEARRGVCAALHDAGYVLLNGATQRLYRDMFGAFTVLGHTPLGHTHPPPVLADLHQGGPGTLDAHTAGLTQQPGQPGVAGHQGGQGASQGGSVRTDITFGNVVVPEHQAAFGGHQPAGRPGKNQRYRNHYIRGHNLGPVRDYKFASLGKFFTPSRLDLSRLHATRGLNLLVRPLAAKTHRGATPPVKGEVVPARLQAQAILTGSGHHAGFTRPQRLLSDTRDADDDHESQEHQDSVADSRQGEEKETSPARRRRAAQGSGVVETRLVTCRAGARRHVNAKCRHTLLPFFSLPPTTLQPGTGDIATGVLSRGVRSAAPLTPTLSCPQGTSISLLRQCTVTTNTFTTL